MITFQISLGCHSTKYATKACTFIVHYYLHVSVDVEAVVLGGEHHGAVVHQRDVETLGVLHLKEENPMDPRKSGRGALHFSLDFSKL